MMSSVYSNLAVCGEYSAQSPSLSTEYPKKMIVHTAAIYLSSGMFVQSNIPHYLVLF